MLGVGRAKNPGRFIEDYFTPDSSEEELVVSMDAMSVLIVRRLGQSLGCWRGMDSYNHYHEPSLPA